MIVPIVNRTVNEDYLKDIAVRNDNNSQYLTFQMRRYFDNIDLSQKTISVKYLNSQYEEGESIAVNVQTTNKTLSFDWLLDDLLTRYAGRIYFQVYISDDSGYVWQTQIASFCVALSLDPNHLPSYPVCS